MKLYHLKATTNTLNKLYILGENGILFSEMEIEMKGLSFRIDIATYE